MMATWMQAGLTTTELVWKGPVSIITSTTSSTSAGTLTGYSVPGWYNASVAAGSIQNDIFVDRRVPSNPKTIRIVGLVNQNNGFVVLGWKVEPSIPPSLAYPSMQGSLRINGQSFTLSTGSRPGVQPGYDGLYWPTTGGAGIKAGMTLAFEFS